MAVFQQTFLGASITNFSTNLGFGSNSSTMSVNLVGDDQNVRGISNGKSRLVNGVREGYSYDSANSTKLFPISLWQDLNNRLGGNINSISQFRDAVYNQGDFFWAPPTGSPVFFSYFDNKRWYDFQDPSTGNNATVDRQYLRDRWDAAGLSFGGILKSIEKQWDTGSGITYSVQMEDPKSILEGTQVVLSDSISPTAPPDQDMKLFFDVGGVQRKLNRGFAGSYNVLNPFGYYELRHDTTQTIFPAEFPFSYNRLDYADINSSGMQWMKVVKNDQYLNLNMPDIRTLYDYSHWTGAQYALESMLGGWNETYFKKGEPFGGGLFYGQANSLRYSNTPGLLPAAGLPAAPFSADALGAVGTHAYRFAVDLSELRKLHEVANPTYLTNSLDINGNRKMYWGGILPNDFRLQGQSMSLLHLIQEVCNTAGADFFVTLLPGCFINHSNDNAPVSPFYTGSRLLDTNHGYYSGVIKINVIQRNREVNIGVISQAVHDATENHKGPWAADSTDCLALVKVDCLGAKGSRLRCEWNDQISKCQSKGGVVQANVGREFTDPVSNIIMYGAARSRVVGVTPIGAARKRKEIFIDQDNSQWSHCWALNALDCSNHRSNGFSDCSWDPDRDMCTGFGETDPYFIEYLPNIELDGVRLQGSPTDESVDSAYGINNDNYINWHWHRHEDQLLGGFSFDPIAFTPHDANALNSVSSIGSLYDCSFSYSAGLVQQGRYSRKLSTKDTGLHNVDDCLNYQHVGRCSDGLSVTAADCIAGNDPAFPTMDQYWVLEDWKDPKGLCGVTKCIYNRCVFDGVDYAVKSEDHCTAVTEAAHPLPYTENYIIDSDSSIHCSESATVRSLDNDYAIIAGGTAWDPFFFVEETLVNTSERYCQWLDLNISGESRVFIPNHWNIGDGFIDLFPMWGFTGSDTESVVDRGSCDNPIFKTEEQCLKANEIWHNPNGLITSQTLGDPILGGFNDDDPYRDFDESDGIFSVTSYYNGYQGSCWSFGHNEGHEEALKGNLPAGSKVYPAGKTFQTITAADVAACLDRDAHDEAHWISYCNNYNPQTGASGDAFLPAMTVYTKVHQHECMECLTTDGFPIAGILTEMECLAIFGYWVSAFPQVSDDGSVMRYENECIGPVGLGGIDGTWELQFNDPLTKLDPVFKMFKWTGPTDSGHTSCEFRDLPNVADNITSSIHNVGYCNNDDPSFAPEDCQRGGAPFGIAPTYLGSKGLGRPSLWIIGGAQDPEGSWPFPNEWVSKDAAIPGSLRYERPATATIPIHFPDRILKDSTSDNIYYATVTELRHAAFNYDAWMQYLIQHDPFLLCQMGWKDCPHLGGTGSLRSRIRNILGAIVVPGAASSPTGESFGPGVRSPSEIELIKKMAAYEIIHNIAVNNYGRTYLMPLPMAPRLSERCFYWNFNNKQDCVDAGAEWGYAGFQNEWTREIGSSGESGTTEERWEIASSAWGGTVNDGEGAHSSMSAQLSTSNWHSPGGTSYIEPHVRYPQHANFWTDDGNLTPFVTYPRLENRRLLKDSVDIDFSEIDPEDMFSYPEYVDGNLGGKTLGKAFVKASVSPKTYWLQTPDSRWNCYDNIGSPLHNGKHASERSCRNNGGLWRDISPKEDFTFFRPYALITVIAPASYTEDDRLEVADPKWQKCIDPERYKYGSTHKKGEALGVCVDATLSLPTTSPDDIKYADVHREHMYEGYGCHYTPCRDITIAVPFPPLLTKTAKVFRKVLEHDRTIIQDEVTCKNQPDKTITCNNAPQRCSPKWSPAAVCETMTSPDGTTKEGKWIDFSAGVTYEECENTTLRLNTPTKSPSHSTMSTWSKYLFEYSGSPLSRISIPLAKKDNLSAHASTRATLGEVLLNESHPDQKSSALKMIAARYKPWYAGVPQQSNRFTWGPWGQTSNFGKAEIIFDETYNPGNHGGISAMNSAALGKIQTGIQAGAQLENESGSVTIAGLPEYRMGSPLELYMVSGFSDINTPAIGPYITDVSLDIGSDGVSTTYKMQTQRSFGDTAAIYERQIHKWKQETIADSKKSADMNKQMRRPDPNSNKRI